jgi:hypothetical protein
LSPGAWLGELQSGASEVRSEKTVRKGKNVPVLKRAVGWDVGGLSISVTRTAIDNNGIGIL